MAAKKKCPPCEEGAPAWIVTFSDLMSLLLTFFVLLLSFSTISEEDFNDAMVALQASFGIFSGQSSPLQLQYQPPKKKSAEAKKAARNLRQRLMIQGKEHQVKIEYDAVGGLKLSLPGAMLYDLGQATLRPDAYPLLREVAETLRQLPDAFIEVRGHTDATPVTESARFRDNYELSYYRADAVARYLYTTGGIPSEQFEITAVGPNQPKATNDTPEGREANRRVEIYVRGLVDRSNIEGLYDRLEEKMPRNTRGYPVSPVEYRGGLE